MSSASAFLFRLTPRNPPSGCFLLFVNGLVPINQAASVL